MKKVLYAVALFFLATACTTKPENKPYTWEEDLHQRLLTLSLIHISEPTRRS